MVDGGKRCHPFRAWVGSKVRLDGLAKSSQLDRSSSQVDRPYRLPCCLKVDVDSGSPVAHSSELSAVELVLVSAHVISVVILLSHVDTNVT
jgi:hypothetical protein